MQFDSVLDFGSTAAALPRPVRLPSLLRWPLPAFGAWLLAWALFGALRALSVDDALALPCAALLGGLLALPARSRLRRLVIALGLPASLLASGLAAGLPAWGWLAPLLLLVLAYPVQAWRDAPFFPTPARALDRLDRHAPLAPYARVLDAGCGLGHGLAALQRAYPRVRLEGIEWSRALALLARLRCHIHGPRARVRQGDMWSLDWSGYDMVYLFQRPESMARAVDKATREMAPGSWLASLEFEAPALEPQAVAHGAGGPPVWLYRLPFVVRPGAGGGAD